MPAPVCFFKLETRHLVSYKIDGARLCPAAGLVAATAQGRKRWQDFTRLGLRLLLRLVAATQPRSGGGRREAVRQHPAAAARFSLGWTNGVTEDVAMESWFLLHSV